MEKSTIKKKTKKARVKISRNILVRDLCENTISQLEFYKNRNGIKTDSKAVLHIFENSQRLLDKLDQLENELEYVKDASRNRRELLENIWNANKYINSYFTSE